MAIWFMDGFDHYSTLVDRSEASTAHILLKWTSQTNVKVNPASSRAAGSGGGAQLQNANMRKTRPGANVDTYIFGCYFALSITANANTIFAFEDGASTEQVSVRVTASGTITFNRGSTILATSTNVLSANTWYHIEIKCKCNNTTGTYEVRINGSATGWIPAATGANTRSTANNQFTGIAVSGANTAVLYVDDVYCLDTTGTANIDFLGPQVITTVRPQAAGNAAQWTPNIGTNFGTVGGTFPDGDTSFVQSATAGQIDTHLMTDLPFASGTIAGIQHVLFCKQSAGAQRVVRPIYRLAGANYNGASFNTPTSWAMHLDIDDDTPADSAAFEVADINDGEFGYELVS